MIFVGALVGILGLLSAFMVIVLYQHGALLADVQTRVDSVELSADRAIVATHNRIRAIEEAVTHGVNSAHERLDKIEAAITGKS